MQFLIRVLNINFNIKIVFNNINNHKTNKSVHFYLANTQFDFFFTKLDHISYNA